MRKHLNYWLFAALVCGMAMSVASCKDDDNADDNNNASPEEQVQDQTAHYWDVVGQLVSMDNYTTDYASRTFEPVIGEPSAANPLTRVVQTNTLEAAVERYNDLTGSAIDTLTSEHTWTDPAIGSMTYRRSTDGRAWATVDVDIRQVPQLRQIVYQSPEQAGTNAGNYATCYYRFGDIISQRVGNITEYWICVRPAFEPEGKKKSHWVCVSPVQSLKGPEPNLVWYYQAKNGTAYALPTGIGCNKEQNQNLAEMLYAICNPKSWADNIADNPSGFFTSGVPMFHDFDKKKVAYHSQDFWQRVQKAWDDNNVWEKVFGITRDQMTKQLNHGGLHLLVKGFSWWTTTSNNMNLFQYTYTNGEGKKSNMHVETYSEPKKDVIKNNIKINVDEQYTQATPYLKNQDFFGDNDYHWIVRCKEGVELTAVGHFYSPKTPISGMTQVYNYNDAYHIDLDSKPETDTDIKNQVEPALKGPKEFSILSSDCNFYQTIAGASSGDRHALGIVVHYNRNLHIEDGEIYNGLVLGLNDMDPVVMRTVGAGEKLTEDCMEDVTEMNDIPNCYDGLAKTKSLSEGCGKLLHHHDAALNLINYKPKVPQNMLNSVRFSDWFIPSIGQWIKVIYTLGLTWVDVNKDFDEQNSDNYMSVKNTLKIYGLENYMLTGKYWTSTQINSGVFHTLTFDEKQKTLHATYDRVTNTAKVRPVMAFYFE